MSPASCGVSSCCHLGTRQGCLGTAVIRGWVGTQPQSTPKGDLCILILCPQSQATTGVFCKIWVFD